MQVLTVQGKNQSTSDGVYLNAVYFTNATCVKYRVSGYNGKSHPSDRCEKLVSLPFLLPPTCSFDWT